MLSGKYNLETVFSESSRSAWNVGGRNRVEYEKLMKRIDELKKGLNAENLTDYAYRFAFSRPEHPTVVIGCTSIEQIKQNNN